MESMKQIKLADGRMLGYAEYGIFSGFPILFFHGLPGSRLEADKLHPAALKTDVRLIGLDRPGIGFSDPKKNRTILDWASDIDQFAEKLNLKTFSILGHSGGAPYTVACSCLLPHKIHKIVIVGGIAPLDNEAAVASLSKVQKQLLWLIKYCPLLVKWMMQLVSRSFEKPNRIKKMFKQLSAADQKTLTHPEYYEAIMRSFKEAFRQGAAEVVYDFKLISKPWGVNLQEIPAPCSIWQGSHDQQAPLKHAEIYTRHIPNSTYHLLPNEGHISLLFNYGTQILASAL
ncbi:MAG: uncharacterized protein K0R24_177 [Gammaproteobacteria bacterium]|nr:uncharacterized protein [Gammaproteobacteria bacterium]